MEALEYYKKVLDHLNQMSTKVFETIDQDEVEAELKKTRPRTPERFARDLFWKTVGTGVHDMRRSVRISRPVLRDPEDGPPPTLPDSYDEKIK